MTGTGQVLDSLGMFDATRRRCPSRSRRRSTSPPTSDGCPTHETIANVVVLGMGGSGIAGDVARSPSPGRSCPCPLVVIKSHAVAGLRRRPARCASPSRTRATPRRRSRRRRRRRRGRSASSCCRAGRRARRELARSLGRAPCVALPRHRRCPAPASASLSASRSLIVLERVGLFPGASGWVAEAVDAAQAAPRPARPRRQRGGRRSPGGIGRDDAARLRRRRHRHGRRDALEDAGERERQGPGVRLGAARGCATTSSAAGASTATSPARCSRYVQLRHDHEHPQVSRRFELVAARWSRRSSPTCTRSRRRGRGRRSPSCSTS